MHKLRVILATGFMVLSAPALALDLDWSGQFRAEAHWIDGYTLSDSGTLDTTRQAANGYYIPAGGSSDAHFQSLFMRLQPKVIVNDNFYIKSEWWVGNPVFGFFGGGAPFTADQRQFYSNQSGGSVITAQRLWGELITDVGVVQVGRMPLHWGLGLIWNEGKDAWSRYYSSGDAFRLVSKFGSFSFSPAIIKYSAGNAIGGSFDSANGIGVGGADVSDYSIAIQYDNPDSDLELGVNFIKRIAGASQDSVYGYNGIAGSTAGANFNTWDIFGRKKLGPVTISGEVPIVSGDIGGVDYSSYAVATDIKWDVNDSIAVNVRAGQAPGTPNITAGSTPSKFQAFFFNPNYKIGLIMFNYQFANFAGPNVSNILADPSRSGSALTSPYDNPIVNARYINFGGAYTTQKWTFHTNWIFASALDSASTGQSFFNYWQRQYQTNNAGKDQGTGLGWEMDYGAALRWDDSITVRMDFGWWFPGEFYAFSNTATDNATNTVFGATLGITADF